MAYHNTRLARTVSIDLDFVNRDLLFSKTAQIFLIAGSGTLGWDQVASNLVEPGEDVLVLNSGYFGDSFTDW